MEGANRVEAAMRQMFGIRTRFMAGPAREFKRGYTSVAFLLGLAALFFMACLSSSDRGSPGIVGRIESFPWYAPLRGNFEIVAADGNGEVLRRVEADPFEQLLSADATCFRVKNDRLDSLLVFVSPERALETLAELEALLPPPRSRWKVRVHESGDPEVICAHWRFPASDGRGIGVRFGPVPELRQEPAAASLEKSLGIEGLWMLEVRIAPIGAEYAESFTNQISRVEGNVAIINTEAWGALLHDSARVDEGYRRLGIDSAALPVLRVPEGSLVDPHYWNSRLLSVVVFCPMARVAQLRAILSEEAGPVAMEIWEPGERLEGVVSGQPLRSVWVLTMDDWLSTAASLSFEKRESWASSPAIEKIVDEQNRVAKLVLRPVSTAGIPRGKGSAREF